MDKLNKLILKNVSLQRKIKLGKNNNKKINSER